MGVFFYGRFFCVHALQVNSRRRTQKFTLKPDQSEAATHRSSSQQVSLLPRVCNTSLPISANPSVTKSPCRIAAQ